MVDERKAACRPRSSPTRLRLHCARCWQGETGIYVQYSELPAGFRIDAHAHSHDEVITLISGSCTVDGGTTMRASDTVCIKGGTVYGFTAGPEGMVFLTIRGGDSVTNFKN